MLPPNTTDSLLAAYDLGAPPELLKAIYDKERSDLLPIYTANRPQKIVKQQDVRIDTKNWTKYLGQEKYA
jgi:Questin oxidase-like